MRVGLVLIGRDLLSVRQRLNRVLGVQVRGRASRCRRLVRCAMFRLGLAFFLGGILASRSFGLVVSLGLGIVPRSSVE
jgi:hypothetical protein